MNNGLYKAISTITTVGDTVTGDEKLVVTGASGNTLIKYLELMNNTEYYAVAHIKRRDASDVVYQDIKIDLEPYSNVLLWDGFTVLNYNHDLIFLADSGDVEVAVTCFSGLLS